MNKYFFFYILITFLYGTCFTGFLYGRYARFTMKKNAEKNEQLQSNRQKPDIIITPVDPLKKEDETGKQNDQEMSLSKDQLLKKPIRDMTLAQLRIAKDYAKEKGNKDLVIKYLERILILTYDQQELCAVRLELADLYFEQKDMEQAGKYYREYVKFYPGSKQRDYAEYKSILTRFYVRLKPPHDPSITKETLILANNYLEHSTLVERKYVEKVQEIRNTCYQELCDYEFNIVNQHLHSGSIAQAQARLKSMKELYLPQVKHIHDIGARILELEGVIAHRMNDIKQVEMVIAHMKQEFPLYTPSMLVAQINPKKSYVDRF